MGGRLILRLQGAEKLSAKTLGGDRQDHNKDLLSRNCMSEIRPVVLRTVKLGLTKVGNQAKQLKYSEKKVVLCTSCRADV